MGQLSLEIIYKQIEILLSQKNYPCLAALKAFHKKEFQVHAYDQLGGFRSRPALRNDLLSYLGKYLETKSRYFTFWAVFPDSILKDEEEFESKLWKELSSLTSKQTQKSDWDFRFSDDPKDKNFCFSLGGKAFFVVGLHPKSSRLSRRFPWPALVFNVYEQFLDLAKDGLYDDMIRMNRKRDILFQGDVNPMTEAYQDSWESIQFSGKKNPPAWKCPFSFGGI